MLPTHSAQASYVSKGWLTLFPQPEKESSSYPIPEPTPCCHWVSSRLLCGKRIQQRVASQQENVRHRGGTPCPGRGRPPVLVRKCVYEGPSTFSSPNKSQNETQTSKWHDLQVTARVKGTSVFSHHLPTEWENRDLDFKSFPSILKTMEFWGMGKGW